jgi:hypothetical protein
MLSLSVMEGSATAEIRRICVRVCDDGFMDRYCVEGKSRSGPHPSRY